MHLYLVQHAEAKEETEDPIRPISEVGEANISKVAAHLAACGTVHPYQIFHSNKTRSIQTADILAQALHPANGVTEASDLAPLDAPSLWAERLNDINEDMMLVGHLPHLSKLAALLLCDDENKEIISFQNAGVVCLKKGVDGWQVRWVVTVEVVG